LQFFVRRSWIPPIPGSTDDFVVSNREISVRTKPGQNTLLLSLAKIPTKTSQIVKALGLDAAGEAIAG
jgi:hypothetical protein